MYKKVLLVFISSLLFYNQVVFSKENIKNQLNVLDKKENNKKHLYWLNLLIDNVKPENTSYIHKNTSVKWQNINNSDKYESKTDCSGLFNSIFSQSYNYDKNFFLKYFGTERPRAENYYKAISEQKIFSKITNISEVSEGDIIAIKYPTSNKNTGHTMFITSKPIKNKTSLPYVEDTDQYLVEIADSTSTLHGKDDFRLKKGIKQGLGKGIFRIYTSFSGNFLGYAWSTDSKANFHNREERDFVIGRIKN
ncbi:MAG: hypothetical protein U0457_05965 [Candidatus Sericytochromatia bacterium]